jgi:NitT/TauT family transport system substrate-binding protein
MLRTGATQLFLMSHHLPTHLALSCLLLAGLGASGCGRTSESAAAQEHPAAGDRTLTKVGFRLDWYPVAEDGGEYQALVKNYYREAGLDVTILTGGPGPLGIQEVAAGRAQFSLGPCDNVIMAVRQGAPLLIVAAHMEHNPQAILVHADSPVRSFKDLEGKSVMCIVGSAWIDYLEHRYGITFNVVPMDYGLARFMADPNFIQQCFITSEPYYVELHGVKARSMLIADSGYDPYRVIFTSKAFARKHPEVVRAFVAGTIRGWKDFLQGDASEARARIQAEDAAQSPALMDFTVEMMKRYQLVGGDPAQGDRTGLITPKRMTAVLDTLVDLKILDVRLPLADFVSFDFLPADLKAGKI